MDESEDPVPAVLEKSPFADTGLFNCATLNANEKMLLKKITCKTTAAKLFDES